MLNLNFEEIYNEYQEYSKVRCTKQGFESTREKFVLHVLPYFKNMNIEDIKAIDVVYWENEILKFKYRNKTNKNIYSALSSFLNYCCVFHDLPVNVCRIAGGFPKFHEEDRHDFYTYREYKKFISGFIKEDFLYKCFFEFMFFTGLRPSEAMALKFDCIKKGSVYVRFGIERKGERNLIELNII